jgi:hypothetical protein
MCMLLGTSSPSLTREWGGNVEVVGQQCIRPYGRGCVGYRAVGRSTHGPRGRGSVRGFGQHGVLVL